eukprot:5035335-Ditylum_brightwellii.AAC.1
MEEVLLSLQTKRLEIVDNIDDGKIQNVCGAQFDESMACLAFARALRDLSNIFPEIAKSSEAATREEHKTDVEAVASSSSAIPNAEW